MHFYMLKCALINITITTIFWSTKNTNYNKWDHAQSQSECSKGSLLWI